MILQGWWTSSSPVTVRVWCLAVLYRLTIGRSGRLQQAIKRQSSKAMDAKEIWMLSILIFIVSLLGEHCNFDHLRREHPGMLQAVTCSVFTLTFLQILQLISTIFLKWVQAGNTILTLPSSILQGPIVEHIYNSLLQLYEKFDNSALRLRILQCLGAYAKHMIFRHRLKSCLHY